MEEVAHVRAELRLGTAGWNVPRVSKERVGGVGSQLERYARVLNATEINSSFHSRTGVRPMRSGRTRRQMISAFR